MRSVVVAVVSASGCGFTAYNDGVQLDGDAGPIDARELDAPLVNDAFVFDVTPSLCFGPASPDYRICLPSSPAGDLALPGTIDTSACDDGLVLLLGGSGEVCAFTGATITANHLVRVTGARPLVLVSTGAIRITGVATLDVSSDRMTRGPGANPTMCPLGDLPAGGGAGGAGGVGGSFGTRGGTGGTGGAGASGLPGPVQTAQALRGGCRGRTGAQSSSAGGDGGDGGGVVYLVAGGAIEIDGKIDASGAGGAGAPRGKGGGGGGGSGGMIALHGGSITIASNAQLWANGGGGGGGASANTEGSAGTESATPTMTGQGGAGDGSGGNGGTAAQPGSAGLAGNQGGGGGGGGVGVIRVLGGGSVGGPNVSPPAS